MYSSVYYGIMEAMQKPKMGLQTVLDWVGTGGIGRRYSFGGALILMRRARATAASAGGCPFRSAGKLSEFYLQFRLLTRAVGWPV